MFGLFILGTILGAFGSVLSIAAAKEPAQRVGVMIGSFFQLFLMLWGCFHS